MSQPIVGHSVLRTKAKGKNNLFGRYADKIS
jgi:hypothetical protein